MMLNPKSEYFHKHFHKHIQREDLYFRRIKHVDLEEIGDYISKFYQIIKEEYFLGIKGKKIFDSSDKRLASLYVVVGRRLD